MKRHFFECLEREVDYDREYRKLENMVINEFNYPYNSRMITINMWLEINFRNWSRRGNYSSLNELRNQIGFPIERIEYGEYAILTSHVDMNKYFLYGEMLLNLFIDLKKYLTVELSRGIEDVVYTLNANLEKAGFDAREINSKWVIVENNAVAIEVAETAPELSNTVIEYNHYLLKGDIVRKKELLKKISDALEPKRSVLNSINSRMTNDFFLLVNKMNVRHNNCDQSDSSRYCQQYDQLSPNEKEEWYDTIYEQGLALFVLLEQQERNKKIDAFKASL